MKLFQFRMVTSCMHQHRFAVSPFLIYDLYCNCLRKNSARYSGLTMLSDSRSSNHSSFTTAAFSKLKFRGYLNRIFQLLEKPTMALVCGRTSFPHNHFPKQRRRRVNGLYVWLGKTKTPRVASGSFTFAVYPSVRPVVRRKRSKWLII